MLLERTGYAQLTTGKEVLDRKGKLRICHLKQNNNQICHQKTTTTILEYFPNEIKQYYKFQSRFQDKFSDFNSKNEFG